MLIESAQPVGHEGAGYRQPAARFKLPHRGHFFAACLRKSVDSSRENRRPEESNNLAASGGKQIDDLLNGVVGAVVGGFEFAQSPRPATARRLPLRLPPHAKRGPSSAPLPLLPQTAVRTPRQQPLPSPPRYHPPASEQTRNRLPPRRQRHSTNRRSACRLTPRDYLTLLVYDSPG